MRYYVGSLLSWRKKVNKLKQKLKMQTLKIKNANKLGKIGILHTPWAWHLDRMCPRSKEDPACWQSQA